MRAGRNTMPLATACRITAVALLAALFLVGCSSFEEPRCRPGLNPAVSSELYFGRVTAHGEVSDAEWQAFLDTEVTQRFPGGFTVLDARGQWRGTGEITRERSKKLIVIHAGSKDDRAKVEAIRIAYRTRFQQDSVLLYETEGCGAF